MSRPVSEAKYNLKAKKEFREVWQKWVDLSNEVNGQGPSYKEFADRIRTYVLNEAKAHLHNNPDCSCRENSEENIDNLI